MAKTKLLVLHPRAENLDKVIERANTQNKKLGPFSAVVLLGISLEATAPAVAPDVPTFFFGKTGSDGSFVDVAANFVCVQGYIAIIKLESGISLAFVNDSLVPEEPQESTGNVDVMFTYRWPHCIASSQKLTLVADRSLDSVVALLRPRYHFAVGLDIGRLHENDVLAWSATRTYRFISLAQEGRGSKWFYAFGIDSSNDDASAIELRNPLLEVSRKRERAPQDCDASTANTGEKGSIPATGDEAEQSLAPLMSTATNTDAPSASAPKRRKLVSPMECFFCLSNPKVEAHMIVSIGKHSYLTIAKGPLSIPGKRTGLSGHCIIIPISHGPSLPDDIAVHDEINSYKETLATAFAEYDLDVVFFEINQPENVHFHVQSVPVPRIKAREHFEVSLEEKCKINNTTFERNHKLTFRKFAAGDPELAKVTNSPRFIQFSIYSGSSRTFYVSTFSDEKQIDLQFPRRVLAHLLRLHKRVSWDRCKQSTAQESEECQKFKKFYEKHDFT